MGLDFSHTEAHWAYSGFMRFRIALAAHEGIDLLQMEGFRDRSNPNLPLGSWDAVTTPLKALLCHSDCDGELTPQECTEIAPRLRQVVTELWPDDSYDRQHGLLLAEGMEAAAAAGEPLEFC